MSSVAYEAKASWGYPGAWLDRWADDLVITESYIRRHAVWVAEEESGVLGFAALEKVDGQLDLSHLWVHPTHQGRGVGRVLVSTVAEYAKTIGFDFLRVVSDPHAAGFYERLGGTRVGWEDASFDGVDRRLPVLRVPAMDRTRIERPASRRGD